MFNLVLNYLADPVYFGVFSLTIGVAYVIVWIISLKEIGKTYQATMLRAIEGEELSSQPVRGVGRNVVNRNNGRKLQTFRRVNNSPARNLPRVTRSARVA